MNTRIYHLKPDFAEQLGMDPNSEISTQVAKNLAAELGVHWTAIVVESSPTDKEE